MTIFISLYRRPSYIIETRKNQKDDGENSVGKMIKFDNYKFETNDEKIIYFIRSHRDFGKQGENRAKIWELGNPGIPSNLGKNEPQVSVSSMPSDMEEQNKKNQEDARIKKLEDKVDKLSDNMNILIDALRKKKESKKEEEESKV